MRLFLICLLLPISLSLSTVNELLFNEDDRLEENYLLYDQNCGNNFFCLLQFLRFDSDQLQDFGRAGSVRPPRAILETWSCNTSAVNVHCDVRTLQLAN